MTAFDAYVAAVVGAFATYFWRAFGVAVGGRIDPNGKAFEWFACVAFAVLAALIVRLILFPSGGLSELPTLVRAGAAGLAVAVFFGLRKNVLLGCLSGAGAIALAAWAS
jgi:branched-subunit amino acid transport protein